MKKKSPAKSKVKPKAAKAKKKAVVAKDKPKKSIWGDVTEQDLVGKLDEELLDAWEKLRAFAVSLGEQRIYPSAKAIMFAKKICYFYVRPQKKYIEVWIFLPRKIEGLKASQTATTQVKYSNMFKLVHADQVEEPLTDWISEAYEFAPK